MGVAIITGGTGAIGSALIAEFAKRGDVAFIYHKSEQKALMLAEKYKCFAVKADVTNRNEVDNAVKQIISRYNSVDELVNNAGISQIKMFTDISELDWYNMLDVHLTGAFNVTQSVIKNMIHFKKGSIINISSIWGNEGASCEVHYSTVKAGLIGFTKALAKEVGPSGIRVNCIAPGVIDSRMNAHLSAEEMQELVDETPLGRIGTPLDVAQAALYLADAEFVTGQILGVDGGFC